MKLESYLRNAETEGVSAADLLAGYQADPGNLRPITSAELLAWGGAAGRISKVRAARDHASDAVASAAESAYLMLTRSDTKLDLTLPDRVAMIDGLVAAGILIGDDKISLYDLAFTGDEHTEQHVTDTLARIIRIDAANAANAASQLAYDKARAINQASIDDVDVEPVSLSEPATPEGWQWVDGVLSEAS